MAWQSERIDTDDGVVEVYAWNDDRPNQRFLTAKIDEANERIEFYPRDRFAVSAIVLEGFDDLPNEFKEAGYVPRIEYYLNKKLEGRDLRSLTIGRDIDDSYRKVRNEEAYDVAISYNTLKRFKKSINAIYTESAKERSALADEFFSELFPTRYAGGSNTSASARSRRVMRNLDRSIIKQLAPQDINQLLDFFKELLATRYTSPKRRAELLRAARVQIDEVALDEIIEDFEKLLADNASETEWGSFLQQNLFLVDSKYIGVIPELNVVLASQRKVDFGLVNVEGYLDLFEIKKPSTPLLASNEDRGNYYWSSSATKAIAQAEKYLFNAERKAPALESDIERERDVEVRVVRPHAVVVIGHSEQLKDSKMRDDFRILRESLRNLEIVLYDELLNRLKNQRGKIYVEPEIDLRDSVDG